MFNILNPRRHHDEERRKLGKNADISVDLACTMVSSGDIVLFSGESQTSVAVTVFCGSKWSHVGIVYLPSDDAEPQLFESVKSPDKNIDLRTGKKASGVRIVSLRYALSSFKGHAVAIRTLSLPRALMQEKRFSKTFYKTMRTAMKESIDLYHGKPYEMRIFNFVMARFIFISIYEEMPEALFCSELVALCLKRANVLLCDRSSIQFIPEDFSAEGTVRPSCPPELNVGSMVNCIHMIFSKTHYVRVPSGFEEADDRKSPLHVLSPPQRFTQTKTASSSSSSSSTSQDFHVAKRPASTSSKTKKERQLIYRKQRAGVLLSIGSSSSDDDNDDDDDGSELIIDDDDDDDDDYV